MMTCSIDPLAELFESEGTMRLAVARRVLGDAYDALHASGVVARADDCMLKRCRDCDDDHLVEARDQDGETIFEYYCPVVGTRRSTRFDPRSVKVVPVTLAAEAFATLLGRDDIAVRERVVGVAWEAMTPEGPLPRPVVLARRLEESAAFRILENWLRHATRGRRAVLITSSPGLAELPLENVSIFEIERIFALGAEGLHIADAATEIVRSALARPVAGRPDKGRDAALELFELRADKGETAPRLTLEAQVIAELIAQDRGPKAPRPKTVEDWIRAPYWKRFRER